VGPVGDQTLNLGAFNVCALDIGSLHFGFRSTLFFGPFNFAGDAFRASAGRNDRAGSVDAQPNSHNTLPDRDAVRRRIERWRIGRWFGNPEHLRARWRCR
jgi:hypothetical protein